MVRSSRQGQVSVEYILIVAFTFAILIPGIYFFYLNAQSSSAELVSAQNNRLGQEMLTTAIKTVAQGEGAWLTLDVMVPDGVEDVRIAAGGSEIVIRYTTSIGTSETVFFSDVKLSAKDAASQQNGTIFAGAPHTGRVKIRFTAGQGGLVSVEEKV